MADIEVKDSYRIDILLVFLAFIFPIISLIADLSCSQWQQEFFWFQRSGSLTVLMAVSLEYRQHALTKSDQVSSLFGEPLFKAAPEMNGVRKKFHRLALGLSIIGTLIWGYGDVLFKI